MESASHNFRQRIRATSRRVGLSTFWRWWMGELAPLIPGRLRHAVQRRRLRPVLAFDSDAAVLWVPKIVNSDLAYQAVASIPLSADHAASAIAGRTAIDALAPAAGGGRSRQPKVVVALAAHQVLRKTITLPAAVEDNLLQVLTYDLDRHTPFKADEVYFDATVVRRDPAKKEIGVDWTAALKTVVDQARRRAEGWGAAVVAVVPDRPDGTAPVAGSTLNLLPAAERPDAASLRRWEIWVPVGLIVVAAIVATALPVWQKRGYAIALMQLANDGRVQADASNALREQLERLTGDYNFALQKKYAFPSAVQMIDDVTRLLPDDTWLTQFELRSATKGKDPHREILVRGESANAGRLVSLFEESTLFEQAAPRSPTTKIQPGPGEIFDLGVQLKPLPPPPPFQLAATVSAETAAAAPPAPIPPAPRAVAPESESRDTAVPPQADGPANPAATPREPPAAGNAPPAPASPAAKGAP